MKANLPKRRLIPKWRPVEKSLGSPEVEPVNPRAAVSLSVDPAAFEMALFEWEKTPTAGHFGDVLSFAIFPECADKIRDIASAAVTKGINLSPTQLALAGLVINAVEVEPATGLKLTDKKNPFSDRLRTYRRLLRENHSNPLLLLDFAQLQLAGGNNRSAERALRTALALMPNNVLTLRTYARYLVHVKKSKQAHDLISRHPATARNPWLMATELALADVVGVSPRFFGAAKRLVLDGGLPDMHVTELAGALSSHQLESGALRDARKFFGRAVLAPNDNVAAQAVTDHDSLRVSLSGGQIQRAITSANEAKALSAAVSGDNGAAATAGIGWLNDEPFSSRPAQFLTGVYIFDDDFDRALEMAAIGLRTDPLDPSLLVNLAYLHAMKGEIEQAVSVGRKAIHINSQVAEPFIRSTFGMIAYMQGDLERGDRFYQESMAQFEKSKRFSQGALCAIFRARSAAKAGHPRAGEYLQEAVTLVKDHPCPESIMLLLRMTAADTSEPEALRLTEHYVYHPSTNILELVRGVTAAGAAPITWAKE